MPKCRSFALYIREASTVATVVWNHPWHRMRFVAAPEEEEEEE